MQLLTQELINRLPKIGANETQGVNALALVKFFTPDGPGTWYVSEFDGVDLCFGLAVIHVPEFGYFSLRELQQVKGMFGLPVERDFYFEPTPLCELLYQHARWYEQ